MKLVFGTRAGVWNVDCQLILALRNVEGEGGAGAAAALLVVAGVDGDAEKPGAKAAGAKALQGAVGGEEGFLSCVLGGLAGGEHPQTEVVEGALIAFDEEVEGVEIALLAAGDQIWLVAVGVHGQGYLSRKEDRG